MNRLNSRLDIFEQIIKELENSIEKSTQKAALNGKRLKLRNVSQKTENRWDSSNLIGIPEKENKSGADEMYLQRL